VLLELYLPGKQIKLKLNNTENIAMRKNYDFSKSVKNPYAKKVKKVKKQITIRLDEDTIGYFKKMSEEAGIPYQNLINLYLRDCAGKHRKLNLKWAS